MTKELTLIDLSSIFWQQWHATADKEVGSAYEATLHKVQKHVNGDNPVAICIDSPPYKRKAIDPEYKAQRDKPSEVAVEQLRRVVERLRNDGFPVLGAEGYEADDIIATIVYGDRPIRIINIVSSDKDLLQLVEGGVTATSPLTGEVFGVNEVVEKFGLMPSELGNCLALMGDKSDNVPGVPGVGAKTAATLLKTHTWEGLLNLIDCDDPDNAIAPPGIRQKLLDNLDNLKKSRELVRLMTDAPIDVDSIFESRVAKPKEEKGAMPMDEPLPNADDLGKHKAALPQPTAIVKSDKWALRLEPNDTQSAWKMAIVLHESRLYTKFKNAQSIFAVILRGRALGFDATTALDGFHVVEGQPTLSAPLMIGKVMREPICDYFKCIETTPETATYITHRKDDPDDIAQKYTYTFTQAEKAELTGLTYKGNKTNWHKRPETMLRWRCATELARMVYPDVVAGLYTPDEISDGKYVDVEVVG